jgi:hypothetical protein
MSNRKTQRQMILDVLLAARGHWVPLPSILELKHSWYRLELGLAPTPQQTTNEPAPETLSATDTPSFPQFGNLAKESYGVD